MLKGIIFDLDGVLVDAVDLHFLALNRALSLFGYPIEKQEHEALYNGLPTAVKLGLLSQRRRFPRGLHSFVNEMKQQYTRELIRQSIRPEPRVTEMLVKLKADGYRIAVASNSIRATVELFLDSLGVRELFDVVLSHEDVAKPKPDPGIYHRSLQLLGISPEEALIIEDSVPGVQAARQVTPNVAVVRGPSEVSLDFVLKQIAAASLKRTEKSDKLISGRLEIVVPMAGMGQRFATAGHEKPKPLIDVFGRPMIAWVIENIRPSQQEHHFTFLCSEQHLRLHGVETILKRLAPGCDIVPVPSTTQGAACTVLLAVDQIGHDGPLLIANSDQWVETDIDRFLYTATNTASDGTILTFPADDAKWSYAKVDERGIVTEVAEKRPISPHATVGIYHFKKARDFVEAATQMIRKDTRVNGEFYVCPVYNELIAMGKTVRIVDIDANAMHGLGTPEDLERFVRAFQRTPRKELHV